MRYLSTHNSYSGGGRGSIPAQLSAKIRYLEFDIHDNGWSNGIADFQLGHLKPGGEVSAGGLQGAIARMLLLSLLPLLATESVHFLYCSPAFAGRPDQSGLAPAALTTFAHFWVSSLRSLA